MKKEEFPTFLNEQPTVVFGRTARELLIMACGFVVAWNDWEITASLAGGLWILVLRILLVVLPAALGMAIALISIGQRPLEEWFFTWLLYMLMPRIYLYKPLEEGTGHSKDRRQRKRRSAGVNDLEED